MPAKKNAEDKKSVLITFWASPSTLHSIDDWRRTQEELPSRSEFLRVALNEFMSESVDGVSTPRRRRTLKQGEGTSP